MTQCLSRLTRRQGPRLARPHDMQSWNHLCVAPNTPGRYSPKGSQQVTAYNPQQYIATSEAVAGTLHYTTFAQHTMYNFQHYFEILDGSTQRFCGRTRAKAVSLVERLGLGIEGTLIGFAARKDTRGKVTPGSSTLDWIVFDGTKGYTLNTKSAACFTVQQSSDWLSEA